jgi:hypothetical protein
MENQRANALRGAKASALPLITAYARITILLQCYSRSGLSLSWPARRAGLRTIKVGEYGELCDARMRLLHRIYQAPARSAVGQVQSFNGVHLGVRFTSK